MSAFGKEWARDPVGSVLTAVAHFILGKFAEARC